MVNSYSILKGIGDSLHMDFESPTPSTWGPYKQLMDHIIQVNKTAYSTLTKVAIYGQHVLFIAAFGIVFQLAYQASFLFTHTLYTNL